MNNLIITVFCTTALQIWSVEASYSYTCYPNNTITIASLPTSLTTMSYFAVQDDGTNCTATGDKAAGTAVITGCDKDMPIYFTFSTYADMLSKQIQGGRDVEILNITCFEIAESGVVDSISNTLGASIAFIEEKNVNVTYDVTSELNVSSASVGEPVKWSITFPSSYTLEITSCTAYPGTTTTTANSIGLITDWCADVTDLIDNFVTNSDNTVASAVIQAFKFYGNPNVYLTCSLKVCPTTTSCKSSCDTRKRRSAQSLPDDSDSYHTTVSRVLRITGPDASSAVQWSGMGFLLMTSLTSLVSLL